MQQACLFRTGWHIIWMASSFLLRLPVRPCSGLDGEADDPPFLFMQELKRSDYAHWVFLEGALTS